VLRQAVHQTLAQVREGASLARSLAATGVFPPMLIHLTASGEASGSLRAMLERAALLEQQSFERRLSVFLTLLEPALILAMGALVLMIVLAILMPIVSINQLVR
jgi:general secretion pathway protein F